MCSMKCMPICSLAKGFEFVKEAQLTLSPTERGLKDEDNENVDGALSCLFEADEDERLADE